MGFKELEMALITMRNIRWGLGGAPLIEDASFQIEPGQRICLLGRNGVGKSTLLKLIEGVMDADSGDVWRKQGLTISALKQDVPVESNGTVFEMVAKGLGELGRTLAEHHRLASTADSAGKPEVALRMEKLQQRLDARDGWPLSQQIGQTLSRIGIDPNLQFDNLSAGMKRRALFCRAIAGNPDLLLLDEPTNHLDIETIVQIEQYILRHVKTVLFVSHDRAFAQRLANRVLELDRGRLTSYASDYKTYLKRSRADEQSEQKRQQRFDKKLSQEEAWIRQGIKARRTRNEGRVRALMKMRRAYRERRQTVGNVRLQIQEAERTGKMVIEAKAINYAYGGKPYISDLSTVIMRGDKIGLIGPNGVGKSTLLKIFLKQIAPDSGSVRHGTKLQVAYFDQLRDRLEPNKSVVQNIGEGNDFIIFNNRKRHVISYLQDFLFTPDRCRTPVHILSGGEKNRLLLAKLFAKPANVLVLDEPTNDLDVETLELLEELLLEYSGTLLLVSHDRAFLNNVATGTLAFEGNGLIRTYPGGYDDWLEQRSSAKPSRKNENQTKPKPKTKLAPKKPHKLGYKEQRELEALPQRIETLEAEQRMLYETVSDPDFYKNEKAKITAIRTRLETVETEIALAYDRWESLEQYNKSSP
jgi:ATP-binding cassette subfamily F protein uup